jgi:acetyltransferase-like isoleucine patch superfamily enzyme
MKQESNLKVYLDRIVGGSNLLDLIKYEFAISFVGKIPGAIGILLRKHLYKKVLKRMGKGVVVAGGVLIRHPRSISLDDNTLIDESCILDSKTVSKKGIYIGKNCIIGYRTYITTGFEGYVAIGDNVHVNGPDTHILGNGGVVIGENVLIAARVSIVSANYVITGRDILIKDSVTTTKGVVIEEDVWLGVGVIVLDGVRIHKGAVVGAGAVVTKDIPEYAVAIGVPAKVVRFRE